MPDIPMAKIISERFELGRAFCTKLWNAARFALMNLGEHGFVSLAPDSLEEEDRWILSRLSQGHAEGHGGAPGLQSVGGHRRGPGVLLVRALRLVPRDHQAPAQGRGRGPGRPLGPGLRPRPDPAALPSLRAVHHRGPLGAAERAVPGARACGARSRPSPLLIAAPWPEPVPEMGGRGPRGELRACPGRRPRHPGDPGRPAASRRAGSSRALVKAAGRPAEILARMKPLVSTWPASNPSTSRPT